MNSLKEYFKPEFLNRLDDVVIFDVLSKEAIQNIVRIQIGMVTKRLVEKEIVLDISDEAMDYLGREGYSPQYGARPLKRLIQNKILNPVASLILSKGIMKGGVVSVGMKNGELTFDVKKGRRGGFVEEAIMSTPEPALK